jgi:hypothetical protein
VRTTARGYCSPASGSVTCDRLRKPLAAHTSTETNALARQSQGHHQKALRMFDRVLKTLEKHPSEAQNAVRVRSAKALRCCIPPSCRLHAAFIAPS